MAASRDESQEPLLSQSGSSSTSNNRPTDDSYGSISSRDVEGSTEHETVLDRSVENEVLPETAVTGRNLGWSSAYILIVSRVIGSGIFATPGVIVRSVGSVGITLVLWVIGALFTWAGLAILLEYGSMLPRSGGDKVYLDFTYRKPRFFAATMIAAQSVLLGFTASNCIVFAEYVLFAQGKETTQFQVRFLALGLLTTVIFIHSVFHKAGIFIQNCLGWMKIGLVLFMIVTGLFVVLFRPKDVEQLAVPAKSQLIQQSGLWEGSNWNWGVIATAFFKIWYSYQGLQNVNMVMNEVKNPVKTLKSAASAALLTACILYLLINVAYFLVVPIDEIAQSGELIAALFFERIFGARTGRTLLPIAVALSAAGNVMVVTFSHARMIQEIGRQGILPFGNIVSSTQPFHAPMGALLIHYIPSLLVICFLRGNIYSQILDIEGFTAQFFALASAFGLLWLRVKRPDLHRPYRAWLPAVWIRIVLSIALIASPFVPQKGMNWRQHLSSVSYSFVGTGVMLFAVLYWYVWTKLLPRWQGYRLEEKTVILNDGTTVTKYIQVPEYFKPTTPPD